MAFFLTLSEPGMGRAASPRPRQQLGRLGSTAHVKRHGTTPPHPSLGHIDLLCKGIADAASSVRASTVQMAGTQDCVSDTERSTLSVERRMSGDTPLASLA